jgi:hypothetical protein
MADYELQLALALSISEEQNAKKRTAEERRTAKRSKTQLDTTSAPSDGSEALQLEPAQKLAIFFQRLQRFVYFLLVKCFSDVATLRCCVAVCCD